MSDRRAPAVVAIIGGGASGTLAAAHLARAASASGRTLQLLLVEPGEVGRGLAYGTDDPRHRLNVPAAKLSAWSDDDDHFLRWARAHIAHDHPAGGFAPRRDYGRYLADTLANAAGTHGVHLGTVPVAATDLRQQGRRLRVALADGTSRAVDAVVLATGHGSPSVAWAPAGLRRSARFVADPWRAHETPDVSPGTDVVLVGAGLTMADMATRWDVEGVRLHVVSRHGMLPLPHATERVPARPAPRLPAGELSLAQLRSLVFAHLRRACADGADWRAAFDALRPITQQLWAKLDDDARDDFVRTAARRWDRARHRIDPALHDRLASRRADGRIVVHAAGVVGAEDGPDAVRVRLADGSEISAAVVVNCTGANGDVRTSDDPLMMNLLASGMAGAGPLGIGVATSADGRLRGVVPTGYGADPAGAAIWAIGPLRRGELWESTAIPEIRTQAADLAGTVLVGLPSPRVVRRVRDPYGLPLTASVPAAARYNDALGRILRVQSGAEELLAEAVRADPHFALGHAVRALLGVEWGADVDVEASLTAAQRAASRADQRERHFVEVATARVREPGAASAAALLAYLHAYPEDALAVSIAVPTIAFGGATEIPAESWALVESLAPAYGDNWWWRGMLAFVRQEQDRFGEALELANLALAAEPSAGHAVHAKAHVHYETGDHIAGLAWLDAWIERCGADASHRAHFAWHAALHELALGDDVAVRRRFATQLAPPSVRGVRALVDSASLLWRARTMDTCPDLDVQAVLAAVPGDLLADPPTPFIALHAAMALAAAGDCRGLARLRRAACEQSAPAFGDTVAPLADALIDLLHGDADDAVSALLALRGVERLGGSAAQREIVEETLLLAARQAGRHDLVASVLRSRLERRESPRDRARLRTAERVAAHS